MNMNRLSKFFPKLATTGQSLVETAIFMPVILILLAGVVEVGNLLVTQNRVSTASRVATGFGANHYHMDYDWSQEDPVTNKPVWAQEMAEVAMNNVTETLDLASQRWDIWTITGTVTVDENTNQASFKWWYSEHAYGDGQVVDPLNEWPNLEPGVRDDVLDALNDIITDTLSNDGLGIIATVAYHDRNSLLGLNAFNFGPLTRVRGLNVMRIDEEEDNTALSGSCILVPIAIRYDQYSLYPTNWHEGTWDEDNPPQLWPDDYPEDPVNLYPPADEWQYPVSRKNPKPEDGTYYPYTALEPYNIPPWPIDNFTNNVPGVPITAASEGFIFRARLSEGSGGFGWLDWDGPPFSGNDLADSLTYPGDYNELYPGGPMDTDTAGRAYTTGDSDGLLEGWRSGGPGEYVHGSTGNINSNAVNNALQYYIQPNNVVLMVVYDETRNRQDNQGGGANMDFRVVGFALSRIVGYNFQGNDKWMVFEFLGWADDC